MDYTPVIEESISIRATPETVWRLLADLGSMRRWSPHVLRVAVTTPGEPGVGTRMRNLNRMGLLIWPTSSQIVTWEPGRELAFRIRENRAVWRYSLAEDEETGGTVLTHRREAPDGISDRALALEDRHFGSIEKFEARVAAGMRRTLTRLRACAEAV